MISPKHIADRLLWHSGATIIGYVTALHLCWAILVSVSWVAVGTTPLATLAHIFGYNWLLSSVFIGAAILATIGAFANLGLFGLALMLPQQMILFIAAWGALVAVLSGTYPDGTERWWLFILSDQLGIILLAPAYTVGVLVFHTVFHRNG